MIKGTLRGGFTGAAIAALVAIVAGVAEMSTRMGPSVGQSVVFSLLAAAGGAVIAAPIGGIIGFFLSQRDRRSVGRWVMGGASAGATATLVFVVADRAGEQCHEFWCYSVVLASLVVLSGAAFVAWISGLLGIAMLRLRGREVTLDA